MRIFRNHMALPSGVRPATFPPDYKNMLTQAALGPEQDAFSRNVLSLTAGLFLLIVLTACQSTPPAQWHWQRAETGLPRQMITLAVAADPTEPNRLWLGSYTPAGLARSDDGGQTWTMGSAGREGNPVFALLAAPPGATPAQGEQPNEATLWAATRTGLLQSRDGGVNWHQESDGLPPVPVLSLAAGSSGRIYAGLDSAGVYVQTETGGWQSLSLATAPAGAHGGNLALPPPEPESANGLLAAAGVLSLAVSPDGQQLYAGTAGQGLFTSRDSGRTWTNAYPDAFAPNLALNPARPAVAIASLRDRLIRTRDGGRTWHELPVAWAQEVIVSLLWRADGALGAGTGQGRLYYSPDGGDSWIEGGAGLPRGVGILDLAATEQQLLAATWTGLYGSSNGGESWRYLTPALGQPNAATLLATPTTLWLGARTGLYTWQPDSRQWVAAAATFPPGGLTALAADPSNQQVLYAGSSGDGLYRSDDGGANWQRMPALGVGVPAIAVDPQDSERVYLLAAWERVYETRNGGDLWQARWDGLGVTTEAISIAVDPAKPYVYVGSDTGLYRSHDGGFWRLVAPTLAGQTILALLAQPTPPDAGGGSVLYVGTTRGVYRSLTNGATVQGSRGAEVQGSAADRETGQAWGRGLEDISVTALLADPKDGSRLYAGTAYNGIYQSVDWGFTWQPIGLSELSQDVIEDLAWGPAGELFAITSSGVWMGVAE